LALLLQKGSAMRIWFVTLSLLATVPVMGGAEEPSCVRAYRLTRAQYFTKLSELKGMENTLIGAGVVSGGGFAACLWRVRSLVACGGLVGAIFVGSQAYRYEIIDEIKQLEDAYLIYNIYYAIKRDDLESDSVQKLFVETGTQSNKESAVLNEFARLMESGELCKKSKPSKSWEEVRLLVRNKSFQLSVN
jgi:hypothetical protein